MSNASIEGNISNTEQPVLFILVNATGGTFTIAFGTNPANMTSAQRFNVSAQDLQLALEILPAVVYVEVTGGPGNEGDTSPYCARVKLAPGTSAPTTDSSHLTGGLGYTPTATATFGRLAFKAIGWGGNYWPDWPTWYLGTNYFDGAPSFSKNAQRMTRTAAGWYRILSMPAGGSLGGAAILKIAADCDPRPTHPVVRSIYTVIATLSGDSEKPIILESSSSGAVGSVRIGSGFDTDYRQVNFVMDVNVAFVNWSIKVDGYLEDRSWVQFLPNPPIAYYSFGPETPIPASGSYIQSSPGRGLHEEVWISTRMDGNSGVGTADDPFDGSTEQKFDALLRSFPPADSMTIHLLPGTFLTGGGRRTTGSGFDARAGWKIIGAGMGTTTLKLNSLDPSANSHGVVVSLPNSHFLEVHDLTIDGNYSLITPGHELENIDGIVLSGNNCRVVNCESINVYGYPGGNESFSFKITGNNAVCQGCYGHDFRGGGYTNGPVLQTGRNVATRNCRVEGASHGFRFSEQRKTLLRPEYLSPPGIGTSPAP